MQRKPVEHLVRELEKTFGKSWSIGLSLMARHYETQNQIVLTATGTKQRSDGTKERRKRITAIALEIGVPEYEKLRKQINHSVVFPYPITLPPLT